jgi:hypothetical protein
VGHTLRRPGRFRTGCIDIPSTGWTVSTLGEQAEPAQQGEFVMTTGRVSKSC